MNERYVYGYNNGWNVENEYIQSLQPIFDGFDEQMRVLNERSARAISDAETTIRGLNREETEDELREHWKEDNSSRTFEDYKAQLEQFRQFSLSEANRILETRRQEFENNRKELMTPLVLRKKELELELQQKIDEERKNSEESVSLSRSRDEKDYARMREIRKINDGLQLDQAKLKHALRLIDEKLQQYGYDENQFSDIEPENTTDLEYDNYQKALENYHDILAAYNDELDRFHELEIRLVNGEIEYNEEYEKQAMYIIELYRKVLEEFNKVKESYEKMTNGASLEDLEKQLKDLEDEYDREYQFRAHEQNGMEQNEDDPLNDLQDRINKLKEQIEKIKNGPIKPEEPAIAGDKIDIPVEEEEYEKPKTMHYDLDAIIYKIAGDYKHTKFDNFIYNNKNIKLFNWHKTNERTFADKPLKLVKSAIGSVIIGGKKIVANIAYRVSPKRREKIDELINNIENLKEEELDFIMKELTYSKFKERRGTLPKVAWEALSKRLSERVQLKVSIANVKLEKLYSIIISEYNEAQAIKAQLNDQSLDEKQRQDLYNQLLHISNNLCQNINEFNELFGEVDSLANAAGLYGMRENMRARKTKGVGGRNASDKDNPIQRQLAGKIGQEIADALNSGDGLKAAEYFIYKEKIKIENTEHKRTLKNRFGVSSVGAFEYTPFIEIADYSQDDYLKTVLQTVVIVSSIVNVVNQIQMRNEIASLNSQLQAKNLEIANANQQIADLKAIMSKYTSNPQEFVDEYYAFIDKQISSMQGASEYFAMTSQAASNGTSMLKSAGSIYNSTDDFQHILSGDLSRQLESIYGNSALSVADKAKQMGDVLQKAQENFLDISMTHANGIKSYLQQFGAREDFRALEQAVNLIGSGSPAYVSNLFNDLVEVARITNNMQALSYIDAINIHDSLVPAVVTLSGIVGMDALDEYRKNKDRDIKDSDNLEEAKDKMKEKISEQEIDQHEIAKRNFERKLEEWNSNSAFYRFIHRKEKPTLQQEEINELERRRGL